MMDPFVKARLEKEMRENVVITGVAKMKVSTELAKTAAPKG